MAFRVAVGQINPALGNIEKNAAIIKKAIARAKGDGADLLVLPELSLTGYFLKDMVPNVAQSLESPLMKELMAESRQISLVIGLVWESRGHLFNNAAAYLEDGEIKRVHSKVYLPTYGMFDEQRYFARGRNIRAFDTKFGRAGILICEDMWHPAAAFVLGQAGVDMIIAPASSPGRGIIPGERLAITDTWEMINRFYAKLLAVYVVFANRVGYEDGVNFWGGSEIVDPLGAPLAKAACFAEDFIIAELDLAEVRRARIHSTGFRDEDLSLIIRELKRVESERERQSNP